MDDQVKAAVEAYNAGGVTVHQLAESFGVSYTKMRQTLLANGARMRGRTKFPREKRQEIANAFMSSPESSLRSLSEAYDCSESTVVNILREFVGPDWQSKTEHRHVGGPKQGRIGKAIVELYETGWGVDEIARIRGVNSATIRKHLEKAGKISRL